MNGKLVDYGRVPQPTISAAQEAAIHSTQTQTYPGSRVEWERFWNDPEPIQWMEAEYRPEEER